MTRLTAKEVKQAATFVNKDKKEHDVFLKAMNAIKPLRPPHENEEKED